MGSIQTKLQKRTASLRKKLYDNTVNKIGLEGQFLHLTIEYDRYEDEEDIIVSASEKIVAYINYPGNEIPLVKQSTTNSTSQSNLHLYDILPIELYAPHSLHINKGDIIISRIKMDDEIENIRLLYLQVVDVIFKASTDIMFIKYHLAPTTFTITDEIKIILEAYKAEAWDA
jgi:hypothetical protein